MSNHTEIRWHGRGGQGAKTAALLLADDRKIRTGISGVWSGAYGCADHSVQQNQR